MEAGSRRPLAKGIEARGPALVGKRPLRLDRHPSPWWRISLEQRKQAPAPVSLAGGSGERPARIRMGRRTPHRSSRRADFLWLHGDSVWPGFVKTVHNRPCEVGLGRVVLAKRSCRRSAFTALFDLA